MDSGGPTVGTTECLINGACTPANQYASALATYSRHPALAADTPLPPQSPPAALSPPYATLVEQ